MANQPARPSPAIASPLHHVMGSIDDALRRRVTASPDPSRDHARRRMNANNRRTLGTVRGRPLGAVAGGGQYQPDCRTVPDGERQSPPPILEPPPKSFANRFHARPCLFAGGVSVLNMNAMSKRHDIPSLECPNALDVTLAGEKICRQIKSVEFCRDVASHQRRRGWKGVFHGTESIVRRQVVA